MSSAALTGRVLTDAIEQLSTADSVERVTAIVARAARDLMGSDGATFVLREDDKCYYADENAIGPLWKGSRFPLSACISGWAMLHRETVVIPDIYEDARIPHDAYRPTFVKSLAMTPIRTEQPIGAVGAYWNSSKTPSHEEVRLLQVLANSAAVALENLELRGAVGRRSAERDELESAIHTLVHDLRGPLGAMMGYAELLADGVDDLDTAHDFARTIVTSGQRLGNQIERMLGLYRITNTDLHVETVDLSSVALEIIEDLARRSEHPVHVEIESGLRAELDPVLGQLMMQNLLDNAFKYSSHTAKPEVRFKRVDTGKPLSTFAIEDNGAGFDPAAAELLFQPRVRLHTQSEFAGNGLGLASVARIVDRHGGTIRAEGRRGAGATFFLGLPVPALAA
jgi:signal transduction histidine kinase